MDNLLADLFWEWLILLAGLLLGPLLGVALYLFWLWLGKPGALDWLADGTDRAA